MGIAKMDLHKPLEPMRVTSLIPHDLPVRLYPLQIGNHSAETL
jgi:hypothetical protein